MTFSPKWDDAFQAGTHLSTWPWSDLVSYVYRYAKPADGFRRVLELGCGAGANIPFFLSLGLNYHSVEGSANAVARVLAEHPNLNGKVVNEDFTQSISFDGPFDLVVDRAALIHNSTEAMLRTLRMVGDRMRPGGRFIGVDWFSTEHQDFVRGDETDPHTRTNFSAGPFAGIGQVHFCDREDLEGLFAGAGLRLERLEHKRTEVRLPDNGDQFAYWNLVATRP